MDFHSLKHTYPLLGLISCCIWCKPLLHNFCAGHHSNILYSGAYVLLTSYWGGGANFWGNIPSNPALLFTPVPDSSPVTLSKEATPLGPRVLNHIPFPKAPTMICAHNTCLIVPLTLGESNMKGRMPMMLKSLMHFGENVCLVFPSTCPSTVQALAS